MKWLAALALAVAACGHPAHPGLAPAAPVSAAPFDPFQGCFQVVRSTPDCWDASGWDDWRWSGRRPDAGPAAPPPVCVPPPETAVGAIYCLRRERTYVKSGHWNQHRYEWIEYTADRWRAQLDGQAVLRLARQGAGLVSDQPAMELVPLPRAQADALAAELAKLPDLATLCDRADRCVLDQRERPAPAAGDQGEVAAEPPAERDADHCAAEIRTFCQSGRWPR